MVENTETKCVRGLVAIILSKIDVINAFFFIVKDFSITENVTKLLIILHWEEGNVRNIILIYKHLYIKDTSLSYEENVVFPVLIIVQKFN